MQLPATARFDSMPRAAIGTALADAVLPPAALADKLVEVAAQPYAADPPSPSFGDLQIDEAQSEQLVDLLREASGGVDFSHYKQPTIKRRLLRRMALNRVSDLDGYLGCCGSDRTRPAASTRTS